MENKDMSDNSNGSNKVDFKEIVITNIFEIEAIVEVLEEKGIMTLKDYRERVNKMKKNGTFFDDNNDKKGTCLVKNNTYLLYKAENKK